MKKTLVLVVLAVLAATAARAQPAAELEERTILGGRVSLLVPVELGPMSEEMLQLKYPSERRPTEVLTNERGSINIAFSHTQNPLAPEQVTEMHASLEQTFKNLYPSARWNRSEVVAREEREFLLLDLWTPAVDTEVRNIMLGTSVDGRFLLISFNVTRELEGEWGSIGERIMDSVRILE